MDVYKIDDVTLMGNIENIYCPDCNEDINIIRDINQSPFWTSNNKDIFNGNNCVVIPFLCEACKFAFSINIEFS